MSNVILNNQRLSFIPPSLQEHFEHIIFNAYFDGAFHDLNNIAIHVDYFAVMAISHYETGNPYLYSDDLNRALLNQGIIDTYSEEVKREVKRVLDYYRMFYADDDGERTKEYFSKKCPYDFSGKFHNMPFIEVW